MLDIGFSELLLLAIVALVVLGPEKLPHAARIAGAWIGRIRRTVSSLQAEIEREVAAQEMKAQMERMQQQIQELGGSVIADVKAETRHIEEGFRDVGQAVADATTAPAHSAPPAVAAAPEPAIPLDQVEMDGEKAYREWLEAQRRNRIQPPSRKDDDAS
jgi:sec-independent protein translocase protein TatB